VLRKGMLNETLFIVSLGKAAIVLDDDSGKKFGSRKASTYTSDIKNMHVAELWVGDIFGEMSVMYRNKCVANVKAIEPLEVITIHRKVWMRVLHHHKVMMDAFKQLIAHRRKENQYFRFGRVSVVKVTSSVLAASRVQRAIKRRLLQKREEKRLAAVAMNGKPTEGACARAAPSSAEVAAATTGTPAMSQPAAPSPAPAPPSPAPASPAPASPAPAIAPAESSAPHADTADGDSFEAEDVPHDPQRSRTDAPAPAFEPAAAPVPDPTSALGDEGAPEENDASVAADA